MYIKDVEPVAVKGSNWKIYNRMPCEVYTRVMGYIRPVSAYWIGKKSEMYSRKYFTEERINNSDFIAKYMTAKPIEK